MEVAVSDDLFSGWRRGSGAGGRIREYPIVIRALRRGGNKCKSER